jgi:hypothetical protein
VEPDGAGERAQAVLRPGVAGLLPVLIAILLCAGCGGGSSEASGATTAAPTSTARPVPVPTTTPPASRTPEGAFLADVYDTPGLTSTMADADVINIGRGMCDLIGTPGLDRETLIAELGTSKLGPEVTRVILDAAQANLCPWARFSSAAPSSTPRAAGTFSEGVYEVGVDIQPGKYRSEGGDGCYWARLDENQEIIDNDLRSGPTIVTVRESDAYLELNRCTWTKSE